MKVNMRKSISFLEGGIDFISPTKISGWVFSNKINFTEVRLISNQELISRVDIDEEREDIVKKFGVQCTPGFSINLINISKEINIDNMSFIAMSFDGKYNIEISFLSKPKTNLKKLEKILKNGLIGLDGHFDGITQEGILHGWAAKVNQEKPISVWLFSKNTNPIEVKCNQEHGGLENLKTIKNCGFLLDSNYLDDVWIDKEIWFTFDEKGEYRLPQEKTIKISKELIKEKNNQLQGNDFSEIQDYQFLEKNYNIEELENHLEVISSSIKNINYLEKDIKKSFLHRLKKILKSRNN